jgi:hypothetical protein
MVGAIDKIIHSWHDIPVRGIILSLGDMDRNHHGAEFSILVTVLLWLCCTSSSTSSPCHHPHSAFAHGKARVSFRVPCTFPNILWSCTKQISSPIVHDSSPTSSFAEAMYRMHVSVSVVFKLVRHFAYDHTATQQSHTSLDSVQVGMHLSYCSSSLLHQRLTQ